MRRTKTETRTLHCDRADFCECERLALLQEIDEAKDVIVRLIAEYVAREYNIPNRKPTKKLQELFTTKYNEIVEYLFNVAEKDLPCPIRAFREEGDQTH